MINDVTNTDHACKNGNPYGYYTYVGALVLTYIRTGRWYRNTDESILT